MTTATKTCAVLMEIPVMPTGSSRLLLGKGLVGAAPPEPDVLEDVAHADGGDEGGQLWRVTQRSVGDPLDGSVEDGHRDHADGQHDQDLADLER